MSTSTMTCGSAQFTGFVDIDADIDVGGDATIGGDINAINGDFTGDVTLANVNSIKLICQ